MLPPRLAVLAIHVGSSFDPSSLRESFAAWKHREKSDFSGISEDQLLMHYCVLLVWQDTHKRCSEGTDIAPLVEKGVIEQLASTLHEFASASLPLDDIQVSQLVF